MWKLLAAAATRHPWKVCSAWAVLAVVATIIAPNWKSSTQDDDIRFLPPRYASVRGYHLLSQAFPSDVFASRVLFAVERPDGPLTDADLAIVDSAVDRLETLRRENPEFQVTGVMSYREPILGNRLISADRKCVLIQVSLGTPYVAVQTALSVERAEAEIRPLFGATGSPKLHVTGPAGVGRDLLVASARSLDHTTVATVVLVIVVLLLIYRSPVLAMVPLITIGVATWVALQVLALMTRIPGVQLVNISQDFCIVILFGAGTDYCLFLISRYQEELLGGESNSSALAQSMQSVGAALVASAGTVMVGLGLMGFAEFRKISSVGPVIAVALAIALVASLTLTPAILRILGRRAFWPRSIEPGLPSKSPRGIWHRISYVVVRRPVLVLAVSLALLVPFALMGLKVKPSFRPTGDLSPKAKSVRGLTTVERHFPAGESGPVTVLLVSCSDWSTTAGHIAIADLCRELEQLEDVAEVRSLTQPLGRPPFDITAVNSGANRGLLGLMARKTKDHFLSHLQRDGAPQYIARIDVVLNSDPFAPRSFESLAMIEALLAVSRPGLAETAELYGVTVYARDVEQIIQRDRIVVNALVVVGVFLILLVVVRKLWLAVYLLATVLLSYYATLGVTAVFSSLWADKPFGVIEWRVPFFLFTILVAIGEDYNILLVTRAFQERLRWGPIEGLRRGLSKTGGTITACGLIMAGTFGTLMIAELGTLVEIGFALAVGVLLDTFVVRPLLVPAFMMLMWKDEAAPIHSKDKVAAFTIPVPGVSRRAGLSATKDGPEN